MLSYKLPVCCLRRPPRATWIYSVTQQLMAICLRLNNVQSHDVGLINTVRTQTGRGNDQVIKRWAVPRVGMLALAFLFSFWGLNDSFREPKRWRLGRRIHQYTHEQDLGITADPPHRSDWAGSISWHQRHPVLVLRLFLTSPHSKTNGVQPWRLALAGLAVIISSLSWLQEQIPTQCSRKSGSHWIRLFWFCVQSIDWTIDSSWLLVGVEMGGRGSRRKGHSYHFFETWLSHSFSLQATVVLGPSSQPGDLLAYLLDATGPQWDCGLPSRWPCSLLRKVISVHGHGESEVYLWGVLSLAFSLKLSTGKYLRVGFAMPKSPHLVKRWAKGWARGFFRALKEAGVHRPKMFP